MNNLLSFKGKHSFLFNLQNLSRYREPLMGVSIIMILLCHARMDGANLPNIVLSVLSLGNWGVDIFLLLSGIGMYFSISKNLGEINWWIWIYRRLKRLLLPYIILESPFWLWYAFHNNLGLRGYFYYISFASYWNEHIGLWFLALLIPLYLLTPILYRLFDSKNKYIYLCLAVIFVLVCSAIPIGVENETINTIQNCLSRIPCYLIGVCIGKEVKSEKKTILMFVLLIILYALLKSLNPLLMVYKGWIWAILITCILVYVFNCISRKIVSAFSFIGRYTLELYIGLDISKNILIEFMNLGTAYWVFSIIGSILIAILYNRGVVFFKCFCK